MSRESNEPRRWTIHGHLKQRLKDERFFLIVPPSVEPALADEESIEVMPVSEHDELKRAAGELLTAAQRWLLETAPGMHINTAVGRTATRRGVERLEAILAGGGQKERND